MYGWSLVVFLKGAPLGVSGEASKTFLDDNGQKIPKAFVQSKCMQSRYCHSEDWGLVKLVSCSYKPWPKKFKENCVGSKSSWLEWLWGKMLQQFLSVLMNSSNQFGNWPQTRLSKKFFASPFCIHISVRIRHLREFFNYIYGMHHQSFFWKLEFLLFKTSQTVLTFGIDGFLNSALYVERSSKNLRSDRLCVAAPHTWRQKILGQKFLIVKGFPWNQQDQNICPERCWG